MADELECMDARPDDPCEGPVEWTTTPDRDDFKHFPRCRKHFERRLESAEKTREFRSDVPPAWFDPAYAGERWDEE